MSDVQVSNARRIGFTALAAVFVALTSGACRDAKNPNPTVPGATTVKLIEHRHESGTHSLRIGFYVLNSSAEFKAARRFNSSFVGKLMPLPDGVDFEKVRLAVLAPEFGQGTTSLNIREISRDKSAYSIRYEIASPWVGIAVMSYPVILVEIPRDGREVSFAGVEIRRK